MIPSPQALKEMSKEEATKKAQWAFVEAMTFVVTSTMKEAAKPLTDDK